MKNSLPYLTTPKLCIACGKNIAIPRYLFCPLCLESLPRTNFHLTKGNAMEHKLYGKVDIEKATAFCYFEKGSNIRGAIHLFKYRNYGTLAEHLAYIYGLELNKENWFDGIDLIVPVPIHWYKKYKRGYNQSMLIALGISKATGIKICSGLINSKKKESQTKKNFFERSENIQNSIISRRKIKQKLGHILIVDDVLTSGSTIAATAKVLQGISNVKISILVIGYAK